MHTFYFNDCLPPVSQAAFISGLSQTLIQFNDLLKKDILIERAIVTEKLPSEANYGNNFTLQHCLEQIPDHVLRTLAFSLFYKYPISSHFADDDDEFIINSYFLTVAEMSFNAVNLAIIGSNEGFLFTNGLDPSLRVHPLPVDVANSGTTVSISNLYGQTQNTEVIESIIIDANTKELNNYEKLKVLLRDCSVSTQFEKDYFRLTTSEKESIQIYFQYAIDRKLITRFFPDTKIVKDVTPSKNRCSVYELRIYQPSAIRVYFNESNNRVFLSSIGFKNTQAQDDEIKAAHNILNKLILTT